MINNKSAPRGVSKAPNKLKEYKITNVLIAKWFGYVSANSFNGSTCKDEMRNGVNSVIKYIEEMNKM